MNYYLTATLEILAVIVAPLLLLYLKGKYPLRAAVASLVTIPLLWYFTYAVLHELSHVAATYLVGGTVVEYKLMPRFWAGEFGRAWITTSGVTQGPQQLVTTAFPYVLDLVSLVAGIVLLRREFLRKPFCVGLVFMLLILRPAFDFVCESIAFLAGDKGDFHAMRQLAGPFVTWLFLSCSLALSLFSVFTVLRRYLRPARTTAAFSVGQ